MSIIWMLIIGLVVGALARLLMPGRDPMGWIVTMILGVAGSLLAGLVGRATGYYQPGESSGFIASLLGAIVVLFFYRLITRRNVPARR